MRRRGRVLRVVFVGWALFAVCARAFALKASLDISQYAHTSWAYRDGFVNATVYAFAQTPDGYLWMATGSGLVRFDGVRAVPLDLAGQRLPSTAVFSLLAEQDGTLWIGTFDGLASWKNGVLTTYPELAGFSINAILRDREGTLWVGAYGSGAGTLCTIRGGRTTCIGEQRLVGSAVGSLHEDADGVLWVGAITGLWRWKPGPPVRWSPEISPPGRVFARAEDGTSVLAAMGDVRRLDGKDLVPYPLPGAPSPLTAATLLRDRNGGIWIGTASHGVVHAFHGKVSVLNQHDGLSGDQVVGMFEDREGTVWVSTRQGLDRFRERPVISLPPTNLSNVNTRSILASRDGSVWIGTRDGLNRWNDGHVTVYRKRTHPALPDDSIDSLYEDERGRVWVSGLHGLAVFDRGTFAAAPAVPIGNKLAISTDDRGGLWLGLDQTKNGEGLVHLVDGNIVEQFSLRDTEGGSSAGLVADPKGGVWMGLLSGGLAHFGAGPIRRLPLNDRPGAVSRVMNVVRDRRGAMWASTENGAVRISSGAAATLSSANGLPCDAVHWVIEDDAGDVWLYTRCGLLRIARSELNAWIADPKQRVNPTLFGTSDGVSPMAIPTAYRPSVTKSRDGKIWFVNSDGVSFVDPRDLALNPLAPPVHVEQLVVDRRPYGAVNGVRLPPRVRDLQIDYTALSLASPEKNRFRVKLEGRDRDWQDVGTRRQAFYTDLGPGAYRFRVVASNNSGVWNETGATLDFSIAPAYYQTRWFAALVVIVGATLLWAWYQWRVAQLARQFNRTLEARVSERTRIARELHDTLLQSFHGALLRFQTIAKVLPAGATEARARLDRALDQAEAAITEGRNAVRGLRASATTVNDLAVGIAALGVELTSDPAVVETPVIDVDVDGESRDLSPLVRDETYRITGEALRNAVHHAQARRIVVTIHYEPRQLRVTVRDDGIGMDEDTPRRQQREGHFGIAGMRERAAIVNGELAIESAPGAGTMIELRVPAAIAYASARASWRRASHSPERG